MFEFIVVVPQLLVVEEQNMSLMPKSRSHFFGEPDFLDLLLSESSVVIPTTVVAKLISNLTRALKYPWERNEGDILGDYVAARFVTGTEANRRLWRTKLLKITAKYAI
uniref:DUF4806 domain-containing protein n=1 Tax=Steinernema glaseri TaxID=37863 RepID=A0A1I7Z871_9BILA